jgi:O-antigen/teichoic acid export membrane protein
MNKAPKKKMLHDITRYGSSVIIAHFVTFFGGIIVARMLGPSNFGLWKALQLILTYAIYSELGSLSAMNREVPYFQGKGEIERVNRIRNVVLGQNLFMALAVSSGLLLLYYCLPGVLPLSIELILFVCALVFLQQVYAYFEILFRSAHDFSMVSRLRLSRTVMDMGMAIVLIYFLNLNGRLLALTLTFILILIYILKRCKYSLRPEVDLRETLKLLRIGFPILMVGFSGTLYFTIDSLLILKFLGKTQLGYYSIALVFASLMLVLPGVISEVLYPRYAERFGNSDSISSLKLYVMVPNLLMAYGFSLILGIAILLLPMAIMVLLPKYLPTIIPAKIILFGAVFYALSMGPGNFLNTINRQDTNLIINGVGLVVLFLLIYTFIVLGWGIVGVALGAMFGHFMVSTFRIVFVVRSYFENLVNTIGYLVKLYAPIGFVLLLLLFVERIFITDSRLTFDNLSMLSLKVLVFTGCYGIFSILMSKKTHLVSEIKMLRMAE